MARLPCRQPQLEPDGGPGLSLGSCGQQASGVGGQFCSLLGGRRRRPPNSIPRMALPGLGTALAQGVGGCQREEDMSSLLTVLVWHRDEVRPELIIVSSAVIIINW